MAERKPNCNPDNADLFFLDIPDAIEEAKAICRTCPIQIECLELGLREQYGIWGGMTTQERRALANRRRRRINRA